MQKLNNIIKYSCAVILVSFSLSACSNSQCTSSVKQSPQPSFTQAPASTQAANLEKDDNINSGLLIGLLKDQEALKKLGPMERVPDDYRTLWIRQADGKVTYSEKLGSIIVPSGNDFWKIENNKFNMSEPRNENKKIGDIFGEYNYYYNFSNIVSRLAGAKPSNLFTTESFKKQYLHNEEGYMGESFKSGVEWLMYAGNNYAQVMSYYFETGGGSYSSSHYDVKMYEVKNLNNLESRSKSQKLIDLLDDEAKIKLKLKIKEYSDKYNKTISNDNVRVKEEQLIDGDRLLLKRVNGKWQVQVPVFRQYYHDGNGSSAYYITDSIDCDVTLPQKVTSHDSLCVEWDLIKQKIPEAKDAVSSPEKDLLSVLTQKELMIFTQPLNGISKASLVIPVDEKESIVSNQWATGQYVKKWDDLMKGYLK